VQHYDPLEAPDPEELELDEHERIELVRDAGSIEFQSVPLRPKLLTCNNSTHVSASALGGCAPTTRRSPGL
jgi:hypothetical protein